jgi:hypothetical protein
MGAMETCNAAHQPPMLQSDACVLEYAQSMFFETHHARLMGDNTQGMEKRANFPDRFQILDHSGRAASV